MQFLQKSHIPKAIQIIQVIEFFTEYFAKLPQKRIYQNFLILEILKLFLKLRKWHLIDKYGLMISENNKFREADHREDSAVNLFQEKWGGLQKDPPIVDIKLAKEQLKKVNEPMLEFNQGQYDTIGDKQVSIIKTLPIPNSLKKRDYDSQLNILRVQIGEILYLLRPLVYCSCILKFGTRSYSPYLISLSIDILRFLIQFKIQIFRKSQKEELRLRAKDAIICYVLRDPFYSQILKQKCLNKVLGLLVKEENILHRLVIGLLDLRSSKCLLL
ncbi:unnamed protein product (macronuclear) [Paramecium tetraurelia]|uniref:Peroxisomal membrane protein PEX16 n=1 Tax=Paramecium tetraurelia TaxID=5888 RepID=A0DPC6_PARTE|nr:uncharacterized protein GSPATT00019075001 [Paramecium tetraurelia]CAK84893.1 unnamed protein product [Paramecium tetraurelia]|eukprot:XP_001452290.1 hypothetical protein (macronuclear) [Paramecium tetraurelia strain d4-2]